MYTHYNGRFERDVTILHPGEYLATGEDIIISTVLGSCIAVALHDASTGIGGLNHFMLPGELHSRQFFAEENGRYGMYAMELLINELMKKGARRDTLTAKVFGGAHVLSGGTGNIPDSNITFAMEFLETERIPVVSSDVGGTEARKVLFFAATARVLLKRFGGQKVAPVQREERAYLSRISSQKRSQKDSDVTLF
ncbi:MAG: chemotaxis protein CheD [Alkalispirochaeta sp.]